MCYDPFSLLLTAGLIILIAFGIARLIHTFVIMARVRKLNKFLTTWLEVNEKRPAVISPVSESLTIRVRPTRRG